MQAPHFLLVGSAVPPPLSSSVRQQALAMCAKSRLPYLVCKYPTRKSSLRPLKMRAHLGRDPEHPDSKNLTTEVRIKLVTMSVNSTQD